MTKKHLIWIIIATVVFISLIKQINLDSNHNLINSNSSIVEGVITNYYETGIAAYYMEYSYYVKLEHFKNKVIPKKTFKNCEHDNKCIGKSIYIKYYTEDPNISEPIYDSLPSSPKSSN